jgi:hypothetical protein
LPFVIVFLCSPVLLAKVAGGLDPMETFSMEKSVEKQPIFLKKKKHLRQFGFYGGFKQTQKYWQKNF